MEKEIATHSSILAWRIPWTEEAAGLHVVCGVAKSRTGLRDEHFHFLSLSFRGCVYVRRRSRDHRPSITGHSGDGWGGDNFSFCTLFLSHKMLLKTLFLCSKKVIKLMVLSVFQRAYSLVT